MYFTPRKSLQTKLEIDEKQMDLIDEGNRLKREIRQIKNEINILQNEFNSVVDGTPNSAQNGSILQPNNFSYMKQNPRHNIKTAANARPDLTFESKAQELELMKANSEEIDTQTSFFSSFFSEKMLNKLQDEVYNQKEVISNLNRDISQYKESTQSLLEYLQSKEIEEKVIEMEKLNVNEHKMNIELKQLEKEHESLENELNEQKKMNPIQNNMKEILMLNKQLSRLQIKRHSKEKELTEQKKRKEVQNMIKEELIKEIKEQQKKEAQRKNAIKQMKERRYGKPQYTHTLMPIETVLSPRKKKQNEAQKEVSTVDDFDKLFEMTQTTTTIVATDNNIQFG